MATYGCLLLFFGIKNTVYDYLTAFDTKWRISFIVFMFSFIFPVTNIFILYKLKRLPSLTLSDQSTRTFPYIMTSLFYFGLFYLLMDVNIWPSVKLFIIGGGLAILLTALINLKTKISAHMVGIGGLLGVLISVSFLIKFDMTLFYVLVIIVAGLVGFARLQLNEHKPYQIYSGFFLGFFVQTVLFFILHKITFAQLKL
jgi:membrane-associated HD superfamily phosphohydrolase